MWYTLLVRVWRDHDGLKIRFVIVESLHQSHSVAVEATPEAAVQRFRQWLATVEEGPGPCDDGGESVEQRSRTWDVDGPSADGETPSF